MADNDKNPSETYLQQQEAAATDQQKELQAEMHSDRILH
jgi:hypothetical protein